MEAESALVANQKVAEAAVVGKPHEVKGESILLLLQLKEIGQLEMKQKNARSPERMGQRTGRRNSKAR